MKQLTPLLVFTTIAVLLAGCATSGHDRADRAATSLHKAAQDIDKGNVQIDAVLAALSNLVGNPGTNIEPQFKKFSASVSKLESLADDVSGHATAMQAQGAAYFQKWDIELAKIHNEDIHTRSLDRKNAVAARFDKVRASYAQTKADFGPFISDLKDIRTALATDLTAGGLTSVKSVVDKANADAPPLRASLGRLSADFKDLGVSLSASTPAK